MSRAHSHFRRVTSPALLVALGIAFCSTALAAPPGGGHRGPPGGQHRPPPFAYEACEGLTADAACTVELPEQQVSGTCVADPNEVLFCRPEHMPEPPPRDH
jgi:hypothetical protein